MNKRCVCRLVASGLFVVGMNTAPAEISDGVVKIGVLTDMAGPYAAIAGRGSVLAARMAVEDFDAAKKGLKVEILEADNQNKVDVATNIVRQWYDVENVDAVVDIPNSAIALAVSEMTRSKNKTLLLSGAASAELTGKSCSPNTVHWTYDTWALANGTGSVVTLSGGSTWFFITVDYAFGHALERDTEAAVREAGGRSLGAARYPLNTHDLRPHLKEAQASKARIVALANAGKDSINAIEQAAELGFRKSGSQLAGLLISDTDIHALGLEKAQGLLLTSPFYWNLTAKTRAWSARFFERHGAMPTYIQAGVYASVFHFLKAVEALRSDEGRRVVAKMKEMQTNDSLFGVGYIRQDGRKVHRLYLFEVKKPAESQRAWDYYKLRGVIPAETAFRSLKNGGCPLVNAPVPTPTPASSRK